MWSFSGAITFLFNSISKFQKIINGLSAYSKDTISELKELFMNSEPVNVNNGIFDILHGTALAFWINTLLSFFTCIMSGFSGIIGTILGVLLAGMVTAIILQAMYNHKDAWHPLVAKIFCALVIIDIALCLIRMISNVFAFSIVGIVALVANLLSALAYSLVLKGILE